MVEEVLEELRQSRIDYLELGRELGQIINEQQDKIVVLTNENRRLKREIWSLKTNKRRKNDK